MNHLTHTIGRALSALCAIVGLIGACNIEPWGFALLILANYIALAGLMDRK